MIQPSDPHSGKPGRSLLKLQSSVRGWGGTPEGVVLTTVVSVPMHGLDLSKPVVSKLQLTIASNSAQKILRRHFFSSFLFFSYFPF